MRILFDHNVSQKLRRDLPQHQVSLTRETGWERLGNGVLLGEAQGEFDVLLTMDANIYHQQNVALYDIAVVVLRACDNDYESLLCQCHVYNAVMTTTLKTTQTVPLAHTEDGTIRVAGTRVSLDVVVNKYKQGATAERLAYKFPALKLADIHAVIAWYLMHRTAVEEYLQAQAEAAAATRQFIEANQDSSHIREFLLARQAQ